MTTGSVPSSAYSVESGTVVTTDHRHHDSESQLEHSSRDQGSRSNRSQAGKASISTKPHDPHANGRISPHHSPTKKPPKHEQASLESAGHPHPVSKHSSVAAKSPRRERKTGRKAVEPIRSVPAPTDDLLQPPPISPRTASLGSRNNSFNGTQQSCDNTAHEQRSPSKSSRGHRHEMKERSASVGDSLHLGDLTDSRPPEHEGRVPKAPPRSSSRHRK